jgi:ABC-type glycerol-3-phosphate transport system substrate-binding protein
MTQIYTPHDWHWIVGGDESRAWSSAAGAYVVDFDEHRLTRIDSEENLTDVLAAYGLPGPIPREDAYSAAIQSHIDATARARKYDSGFALASYANSAIWGAEAAAFISWRDAVWLYSITELARVTAGEREMPSINEFLLEIAEQIPITWPGE